MLTILTVTILSSLAFVAMPALARMLIKRSMARFNKWFESGLNAYTSRNTTDAWEAELAHAWEVETRHLAADGALNQNQQARASRVLGKLPEAKDRDRSLFLTNTQTQGALAIISSGVGALVGQIAYYTALDPLIALLASAITALGLCLALTDVAKRIIPDAVVVALCFAGAALRIACGNKSELALLICLAVFASVIAFAINALHFHRHHERAIGGGDAKALSAIVLCSGSTGLLPACATMLACILAHASISRIVCNHTDKLVLGPSIAAALFIGTLASTP